MALGDYGQPMVAGVPWWHAEKVCLSTDEYRSRRQRRVIAVGEGGQAEASA